MIFDSGQYCLDGMPQDRWTYPSLWTRARAGATTTRAPTVPPPRGSADAPLTANLPALRAGGFGCELGSSILRMLLRRL